MFLVGGPAWLWSDESIDSRLRVLLGNRHKSDVIGTPRGFWNLFFLRLLSFPAFVGTKSCSRLSSSFLSSDHLSFVLYQQQHSLIIMSTTAYTGGAGIHLQNLFLDNSTTAEQKADCVSPTCSYVERSFSRETSLIASFYSHYCTSDCSSNYSRWCSRI